ncbi:MAG TPA: hypothetical protein VGG64_22920 [Pirellulales bacterium]
MPQASYTRRHWFQFSLGSMFLLTTIFAIWLGCELKIIRDRSAMRKWINENGGSAMMQKDTRDWLPGKETISAIRIWLGDGTISMLSMPPNANITMKRRIQALFPELRMNLPSDGSRQHGNDESTSVPIPSYAPSVGGLVI